jgi:hypothetical protein
MPEPRTVDIHLHVVMHEDIVVAVETMSHLNGSLDDMRIHVADAPMVDSVDDGLAALHEGARGFASRRGLGPLGQLLALLCVEERQRGQKGREADHDFSGRNGVGKSHGYLPSLLCV